jgi:hypothetical protein
LSGFVAWVADTAITNVAEGTKLLEKMTARIRMGIRLAAAGDTSEPRGFGLLEDGEEASRRGSATAMAINRVVSAAAASGCQPSDRPDCESATATTTTNRSGRKTIGSRCRRLRQRGSDSIAAPLRMAGPMAARAIVRQASWSWNSR